jgi:hypothetical protein
MNRTIIIRREYLHFIPKYARYEKRHKKLAAHVSPAFRVMEGDQVTVGQCRPLSKTVRGEDGVGDVGTGRRAASHWLTRKAAGPLQRSARAAPDWQGGQEVQQVLKRSLGDRTDDDDEEWAGDRTRKREASAAAAGASGAEIFWGMEFETRLAGRGQRCPAGPGPGRVYQDNTHDQASARGECVTTPRTGGEHAGVEVPAGVRCHDVHSEYIGSQSTIREEVLRLLSRRTSVVHRRGNTLAIDSVVT